MSAASRDHEIDRMLLWFKAQLPPHELGCWYIETRPEATTIENDESPRVSRVIRKGKRIQIQGHAECVRCGKRYEIPSIGNFVTSSRVEAVIAEAKAWVARNAERDGPCWGDVPEAVERMAVTLDALCVSGVRDDA